MEFKSVAQAKKETGLTYLGLVNNSTKHEKAWKYDEMVYTIYLAPANTSGYEVCPGRTAECTTLCLNASGRNKMDTKRETINTSRIKKVKLFFEHREYFMKWLIADITREYKKAIAKGMSFSVRLNNTSDISPEDFYIIDCGHKRNILELFPGIQFYDYSKVPARVKLMDKYSNYDITFSFNGYNWNTCERMLKNGIRVAAVFDKVPDNYMGYKVIDADKYDMRYRDDKGIICGLKYKKVRNKLKDEYKFVIRTK